MRYDHIYLLLKNGYPYEIKGNGGYNAVLTGIQPLLDGDYCGIYRYPGGDCCHDKQRARAQQVLQWLPDGYAWWIILAQDGDGKVHKFRKLCDDLLPQYPDGPHNPHAIDYFEMEVQKFAEIHGGCILCVFRERDVVETYTL